MKRLLLALGLISILLIPTVALAVHANDDAVTQNLYCTGNGETCIFTFSFKGDSTDGVIDADVASGAVMTAARYATLKESYYLYVVITNPGLAIAPTALYDITLTDDTGLDVTGGMLADRSATVTQRIVPKLDTVNSVYGAAPIRSALTLNITNQNVNNATGDVILVFVRN